MIEKIGRISFIILVILLISALNNPFICSTFNINIFKYFDSQVMFIIGVASLCVTFLTIGILYILDTFF